MPGPNYDELAQQHGGGINYDSLAAQHGATAAKLAEPSLNDDQLIQQFGFDPKIIKSSPRYQEAAKQHGSGVSFMLTQPKQVPAWLDAWRNAPGIAQIEDTGKGAHDVIQGVVQLARHGAAKLGMITDADAQYGDLLDRVQNADYQQNVRHGNASAALRLLGNVLMPMPGGQIIKGEGIAASVARGAIQGAAGGAMQPTEAPGPFGMQKLRQVGIGAAAGAGIAATLTGGGKAIAKAINARAGRFEPDAAATMATAERYGIPTTYGDVSGNPTAQKIEVALESVPGGTSKLRRTQQEKVKEAAAGIADNQRAQFLDTEFGDFKDIADAAERGDEYARGLMEKIQNAGNDPDKVQQVSIGVSNFRTREQARQLYDVVENLSERHHLGNVPMKTTQAVLDSALKEAEGAVVKDKPLIGLLQEVKTSLSAKKAAAAHAHGTPAPPQSGLVDAYGRSMPPAPAPAAVAADTSYGRIRGLRSDLGDIIRSYQQGDNGIIGEKGIGTLERMRSAVESDLQQYAQNSGIPEIQQAARRADEYYKAARVPFKDGMLAQAAGSTEPDQIFQQFIKAGKGDRAQKFYDALDPKGQAAVRYNIVAKAVNDATDNAKGVFSPMKFFRSLDKLDEAYGVFFRGADKWELDGFKNLMAHLERAGQFAENPPTGNRLLQPLILGGAAAGAFVNAPVAAKVAALTVAAKMLLTSRAGQRFLLASSSLKPGSPAMDKLVSQLSTATAKGAARPRDAAREPSAQQPE